ncbi:hypothetical protein [Sediminicola luteus]|nr:hypothetical protein [Sediminicola luteus]
MKKKIHENKLGQANRSTVQNKVSHQVFPYINTTLTPLIVLPVN